MQAYYDEIEKNFQKPTLDNLKKFADTEVKDAMQRFDDYLNLQFYSSIK